MGVISYYIIRFTNEEVLYDTKKVTDEISDYFKQ